MGFLSIVTCMAVVVLLLMFRLIQFQRTMATIEDFQSRESEILDVIDGHYRDLSATALIILTDPGDGMAPERSQALKVETEASLRRFRATIEAMMSWGEGETIERIDGDLLNLNAYNERLFNVIDSLRSSHSTDAFLGYTAVVDQVRDRLRRLESRLDALALRQRNALRGRVHELIWFTLASFGVALCLGLVMSVAIARSLIAPISALSESAGRLAAGDFDAALPTQLDPGGHDELANLARSFTTMANALKQQVEKLNELNATLETRVADRTAELARRNEELDTFTYTVSHDLKSPVVALQGLVSILVEDYGGRFDAEGRRYLDRLAANVTHMDRLIRDLLALSRVGRTEVRYESVAVEELVEEIVAIYAETINVRRVCLDTGSLPVLVADRSRLRQVLENLLSNALKFLGDQPKPCVGVRCEALEGFVRFEVRDNGIGIDPAYHDRIFTIFQRLQDVEVEGTGVGLAIVRKIVEQAGGRISVQSSKGQGSVFSFTWPRRRAEHAAAA
jgi:signal transduction histidine kinase